MFLPNKILSFTIALLFLTIVAGSGFAQDKVKHKIIKKERHPVSIGFQTGRELLFNSTPLVHSRQNKLHYSISKTLVLRKPLNSHFKLETGLGYSSMPNTANPAFINKLNNFKPYKVSAPVTLQYYLLPEKYKLRPFCGAGFQCNMPLSKNSYTSFAGDSNPIYSSPQSDTKYITILFTQGVTFEVNTRIEITQSFHFIPENTNSVIGIDLGIGYNLP